MLPVMATQRSKPKPPPSRTVDGAELVKWLKDQIGDTKHEGFAAEIGVSRQMLSAVMTGRRVPGDKFCKALRRFGLLHVKRVYVIRSEP
jgi:transcriptional regulator with XRE-family HTH domain